MTSGIPPGRLSSGATARISPCAIIFPFTITARKRIKNALRFSGGSTTDRIDTSGGTWEQTYRYLFFSTYTTEIDAKGDWREKNRIWPLCFSTSRPGFSHFHAPELIFMQSPGFDRLFGPWVYLWTQDRQDTYRQGKAFWGMYRWQEDKDYSLWELSFLAGRETTATTSKFRLLSGLVTWEREGSYRRLKLFYLPQGFSW